MALERISPLVRASPAQPARSVTSPVPPATPRPPGDGRLQLTVAESPTGELLGRSRDGRSFQLGAATGIEALLQPGQVLTVRILRTSPTLELMVLGPGQGSAGAAGGDVGFDEGGGGFSGTPRQAFMPDADPAALQTDQAAMRRITRSAMAPPVLASAWRTLVLSHLQRAGTVQAGTATTQGPFDAMRPYFAGPGGTMPTAPLRLPLAAMAMPDDAGPRQAAGEEARLMLRVQAWSDLPVCLYLVPRGVAYHGANRRSARRNGARLRLSVEHANWGPIGIEVDVLDAAVALTLTAALAQALAPLRASVNAIVQRLIAAGLRLVRCRVEQAAPPALDEPIDHTEPPPTTSAQPGTTTLVAADLPLVLFRAATEILAALSPPSR